MKTTAEERRLWKENGGAPFQRLLDDFAELEVQLEAERGRLGRELRLMKLAHKITTLNCECWGNCECGIGEAKEKAYDIVWKNRIGAEDPGYTEIKNTIEEFNKALKEFKDIK